MLARLRSTQNGSDASYELACATGLIDVVVGSKFQTDDTINFVSACGDHDDGNIRG
jgi:hypothetical protein